MTKHLTDDTGAAGVEYGILLGAIAAAIVLVAYALGDKVEALFGTVQIP